MQIRRVPSLSFRKESQHKKLDDPKVIINIGFCEPQEDAGCGT